MQPRREVDGQLSKSIGEGFGDGVCDAKYAAGWTLGLCVIVGSENGVFWSVREIDSMLPILGEIFHFVRI